jgi:hypothetical protein
MQSIEEILLADNLPRGASALINFTVLLDRMYVIEEISRKKLIFLLSRSSNFFSLSKLELLCISKPETNHSGTQRSAGARSLTVFAFIIIINVIQLFFL